MNSEFDSPDARPEAPSTVDVLIARIVDHAADEHDWAVFSTLAAGPQGADAWRRLAQSQRDAALLSARVDEITRCANAVDLFALECESLGRIHESRPHARPPHAHRAPSLPRFAGWAVAAAVAFAWMATAFNIGPLTGPRRNPGTLTAGWPIATSDDAVKAYLDVGRKSGRVIGEMPQQILLTAGPSNTQGKVDLVYIRQFVERATVDDVVGIGADEAGRLVPGPIEAPVIIRYAAD